MVWGITLVFPYVGTGTPTLMATSTALSCSSHLYWPTTWRWPLLSLWMLVLPMLSGNNNLVPSLQRRISSLLQSRPSKSVLELMVKALRVCCPALRVLQYIGIWGVKHLPNWAWADLFIWADVSSIWSSFISAVTVNLGHLYNSLIFCYIYYLCEWCWGGLCSCDVHALADVCKSEDQVQESVLSYHISPCN